MSREWKDISVPLYNDMVHWPGDQDFYSERIWDIKKGSPCNVSLISMCSHTGTHMDPPLHFLKKGKSLDKLPLEAVIGPARVIEINNRKSIIPSELKKHKIGKGERILFKTLNSGRCWKKNRFVEDFVYVSKEAAEYLARIKVRVIGIDYLSVGGFEKESLETHQALLKTGVWIIEGLNLCGIKAGNYEMICLPLRILNSDGAPARAVIREI